MNNGVIKYKRIKMIYFRFGTGSRRFSIYIHVLRYEYDLIPVVYRNIVPSIDVRVNDFYDFRSE